ncbi:glutamate ionotropic kainate 2-like protein, partial [Dinothrombium tinctorium]
KENKGLIGVIKFDDYGQRNDLSLDVIDFQKTSYKKDAVWNQSGYFQLNKSETERKIIENIKNITFRVATILKKPYMIEKIGAEKFEGKEKYEGYFIDLKEAMANEEGFDYEIFLNPENSNGYGIALIPVSPYRLFFSNKILAYEESGKLAELKNKWWEEKVKSESGIKCDTTKKVIPFAFELNVEKIGGVFLVLLAGTGIGCLIVILEFVCKTKNISRKEK